MAVALAERSSISKHGAARSPPHVAENYQNIQFYKPIETLLAIMPLLNTHTRTYLQSLQRQTASLLLYQNVLNSPVTEAFLELIDALSKPDPHPIECLKAYGTWFKFLAQKNQSWPDYLADQILKDDNPFTQQVQQQELAVLPPALLCATKHDLQILQQLYNCNSNQLSQWVQEVSELPTPPIIWDREVLGTSPLPKNGNWEEALAELATYYRDNGIGIFAEYRALRWQSGKFIGIARPDPVKLEELAGYESQKEALLKNTEFLLAGYRALHVLLYGSRGSGKSSLVKGLLNYYDNLRLIEVTKSELKDLPTIVEQLQVIPHKCVIFVDDLSFEENDDSFKALKVVLEGNITARPQNVAVYATSNRRHLVREFFGDRPRPSNAEEVHGWDTMQEKLSFSDRFGLTLTFEPADRATYLTIVRHLASQAKIPLAPEDLEYRALQWATRYNGRSGRTARQFVDFIKAELWLNNRADR